MRFSVGCEIQYDVSEETTLILNVEAQHGEGQEVLDERFSISSGVPAESHVVPETGNRYRRLKLNAGQHLIAYSATVETRPHFGDPAQIRQVPIAELPFEVISHLSPSRYCQSDRLGRFAWRQFGNIANGYETVTAICNWIFENVDYLEGSSDISTSAYDTFTLRAGVCRREPPVQGGHRGSTLVPRSYSGTGLASITVGAAGGAGQDTIGSISEGTT